MKNGYTFALRNYQVRLQKGLEPVSVDCDRPTDLLVSIEIRDAIPACWNEVKAFLEHDEIRVLNGNVTQK